MSKAAHASAKKEPNSVGFFHMVRDVLVAAINKGQLILGFVGIITFTLVLRMPSDQVGVLVFRIVGALESGSLLGYAFFLLCVAGWHQHAKYLRLSLQEKGDKIKLK